jgi:hypothetical protein
MDHGLEQDQDSIYIDLYIKVCIVSAFEYWPFDHTDLEMLREDFGGRFFYCSHHRGYT